MSVNKFSYAYINLFVDFLNFCIIYHTVTHVSAVCTSRYILCKPNVIYDVILLCYYNHDNIKPNIKKSYYEILDFYLGRIIFNCQQLSNS